VQQVFRSLAAVELQLLVRAVRPVRLERARRAEPLEKWPALLALAALLETQALAVAPRSSPQ
jgi:hypothetical protein